MNDAALPTAVLGFGVTGASVVRHLRRQGQPIVVLDTRAPRAVDAEFADVEICFDTQQWPSLEVARAVVSPGLSMNSCLVRGALNAGVELVSDIDLFFESVAAPVIGVTGTNGKSTVTAWTGHTLQRAGIDCAIGGNIGEAALDLLEHPRSCYVLELSSFQLERSRIHSFAAVCILNITEDHLDSHGDMHSYAAAKQRIFAAAEVGVYNRQDLATQPRDAVVDQSDEVAGPTRSTSFGMDAPLEHDYGIAQYQGTRVLMHGRDVIMPVADLPLHGVHNELNALAVCALVSDFVAMPDLAASLAGFTSLPHRFAQVASFAGVTYVNDSKATNVGATMAALDGMSASNNILLIAGGDAKGVSLDPLSKVLKGRVRSVFAIGKDAAEVERVAALSGVNCLVFEGLSDAVRAASESAVDGDFVLLSPACSSLDMFANYGERGEVFEALVRELEANYDG